MGDVYDISLGKKKTKVGGVQDIYTGLGPWENIKYVNKGKAPALSHYTPSTPAFFLLWKLA